jgi:hypothetical protein
MRLAASTTHRGASMTSKKCHVMSRTTNRTMTHLMNGELIGAVTGMNEQIQHTTDNPFDKFRRALSDILLSYDIDIYNLTLYPRTALYSRLLSVSLLRLI